MNTWNKQEIENIVMHIKAGKIVKIKQQIFIAADINSDDEIEVGFAQLAMSAGGACIARVNIEHVRAHLAEDRPMGYALQNLMGINQEVIIVVISHGAVEDEDGDKAQFMIAHELGHIHYKHYEQLSPEEIHDSTSWAEREADEFATEVLGSLEPAQKTFLHMLEKLNGFLDTPNAPSDYKDQIEKIIFSIETRLIWAS